MEVVAHAFAPRDVVAGHPALDLVNTVTARDAKVPRDWLDSYDRYLDWSDLAGVLAAADSRRLRELAKQSPRRAAAELQRVKLLREALHDIFAALIETSPVPDLALRTFDTVWRAALGRAALTPSGGGVALQLRLDDSGFSLPTDRLSLLAIDLLRDFPVGRARLCAGGHCGWLFIDVSKAGRRVWCDMATCGNAAKTRRHQARRGGMAQVGSR